MLDKVLVANRGEIAVRVLRACRELGLRTVAVYSEPDRLAPHVLLADEALAIGPAAPGESYLSVSRLLEAARAAGADAVHPGYGFLAENAGFARAVEEAGLVFVGPPPGAIEAMGDKTRARQRMVAAGVPVVPGSPPLADAAAAGDAAGEIGYPVMLKAAAGGGGKGMRIAHNARELASGYERAVREAVQSFGDGRVYLERFLERPRHIEIQILADDKRVLHLGERECTIQRRHQKLIEESPSPAIDRAMRERMGSVAVLAAEAVGYRSAGTVEFLYEGGEFWFLEMNTRIQVEHPVTELVTGIDLVREQLRIAGGGPALGGSPVPGPRGHAIECRISAEDPERDFLPSAGRITALEIPQGPGIRWDGGVRAGSEVGLHYDPLLGKLIVHDVDREAAIARMREALAELRVEGVPTTASFHRAVMEEPDFRAGDISTRYVTEHPELGRAVDPDSRDALLAAALAFELKRDGGGASPSSHPRSDRGRRGLSPWVRALSDA